MEKYDKLCEKIESLKKEEANLSDATNENIDYEKLAKVRSEIDKLELESGKLEQSALGASITEADIAHVIELWTGIPASKVKETEIKNLKIIARAKREAGFPNSKIMEMLI